MQHERGAEYYLRLRRLPIFASLRVKRPLRDFKAALGILAFLR